MSIDPVRLTGEIVTLEPLTLEHLDGLRNAVRDGDLNRLWYTSVPAPALMREEIERRLGLQDTGAMLPFTIVRNTSASAGEVIGMTTYMNIDEPNRVLEIGSTWLGASHHGSGVNPEMKLLLLRHAFDVLGFRRVELRTHAMNTQSRAAIEKLGAKLDGILRRHMELPNGTVRDTCVYSILDYEWPSVRAGLEHRLGRS